MILKRSPATRRVADNQKLVSVVTIALNAARELPLTIESVAGQDFEEFEYVVVDGQSWDASDDVFRRYSAEIDKLITVEDSGVYSAMNFAVQHCSGKYIIFMNAGDAFYSSRALSNVFSFVEGEDPDFIHGDHVYVDKGLELHKRSVDFAITRKELLEGKLSHKWHDRFPCHQATFTKREVLERLGGYDTRLEVCADHDLFLRAFDAGATTKYIDETVAHYFGGGMSAQRGDRCILEWIKVYRSRSRFPQEVDKFFHADRWVHYDSQSEATGAKLSGFYPLEGPLPGNENSLFALCAGDGFSVVSPRQFDSVGLVLEGENRIEGQRLIFGSAGQFMCEIDVPLGQFRLEASFPRALSPQSIVDVLPARGATFPGDDRFVSILLTSFYFQPVAELEFAPLSVGREYSFGFSNAEAAEPLLRGGWSDLEQTHIWSLGLASHLILPIEEAAHELSLVLSGNPWVPEERRRVAVSVNGELLDDVQLSTTPVVHSFALDRSAWRPRGANFVTLSPRQTAKAPNDPRDLGVCLFSVTVK